MSDVTLSAAIMAHPKRAAFIPELLDWLGDPDIPVVWDERNDRWDTGRRSMLAYDPACTHHVVIQDDVIPCRDLLAGLKAILERVPDAPLCGYVGHVRPQTDAVARATIEAETKRASFITMATLNWGPLIAVPTGCIDEMIAYCDPLTHVANYDRRLSRYWELARNVRVWYAWPCLVDHRDGPSLVAGRIDTHHHFGPAGRRGGRIARSFIGRDGSALDVDWSGPAIHAGMDSRYYGPVVTYRHMRADKALTVPANSHRAQVLERNPNWEPVT